MTMQRAPSSPSRLSAPFPARVAGALLKVQLRYQAWLVRAGCERGHARNRVQDQLCLVLFLLFLDVLEISSLSCLHWRPVTFRCPETGRSV